MGRRLFSRGGGKHQILGKLLVANGLLALLHRGSSIQHGTPAPRNAYVTQCTKNKAPRRVSLHRVVDPPKPSQGRLAEI